MSGKIIIYISISLNKLSDGVVLCVLANSVLNKLLLTFANISIVAPLDIKEKVMNLELKYMVACTTVVVNRF